MDNPQDWKKCGRCKQAFYCGKACQVEHWKRGGHKLACKAPMACCICLDNDGPPLPIQCGCGCREEAGCAHVACKIAYAKHQGPGYHEGWYACPTCKQDYTGAMQLGLAEALWARLQGRPAEDDDRLCAQNNLANAYMQAGRYAEAEALYRDILAIDRRVHGPNHENTLVTAGNLGNALLDQGKHSDAEAVLRDTLERQREVLGAEHESTLRTASSLATALQNQGKYAEAEPVLRDTLAIQQRVLGDGHANTLATASSLAALGDTPGACAACGCFFNMFNGIKQRAGSCRQLPRLEDVRALQAGVLLRQSMPSRALAAGRAQAGVQGADGVLHLLGQRRPAAAHPGGLRVPGRDGLRSPRRARSSIHSTRAQAS